MTPLETEQLIATMINKESTARVGCRNRKDFVGANMHGDRENVLRELQAKIAKSGGIATKVAVQASDVIGKGALVTLAEAAEITGYTANGLLKRMRDGKLTGVKIGRHFMVPQHEIAALRKERVTRAKKLAKANPTKTVGEIPAGYISMTDAAKIIGITPESVLYAGRNGKIKSVRVGKRRVYYEEAGVVAYKTQREQRAPNSSNLASKNILI